MPAAPVTIPLDVGVMSRFLVSGITGTDAPQMNGTYSRDEEAVIDTFDHATSGNKFVRVSANSWELENAGGFSIAQGSDGEWPWLCTSWSPDSGSWAGTFVFSHAPPAVVPIEGAGTPVHASYTTSLTGTNNDLVFTSVPTGPLSNTISVRYVSPGTNNAALSVVVSGAAITVNLATNGSAVITTTAAQVKAAIEASAEASALVTVANAAGNNGSGVVTAMAATFLFGGSGEGLPLPPVTIPV